MIKSIKINILLLIAIVAGGWTHGGGGFNGGATQVNPANPLASGDGAFINMMKSAQSWSYNSSTGACGNTGIPTPDELNSDGYPLAGSNGIVNCNGLQTLISLPTSDELINTSQCVLHSDGGCKWVVDWSGNCVIGINATLANPGSGQGLATVSGSGGTKPTTWGTSPWILSFSRFNAAQANSSPVRVLPQITGTDGTCTNLRFYNLYYQSVLNNNSTNGFNPYFIKILKDAKVGALHFENWQGNFSQFNSNVAWGDDKPTTYVFYDGPEYRNTGTWAGTTGTGGGCTESITGASSIYCLSYGSGAPVDHQRMIVMFDQTDTFTSNPIPPVYLNLNNTGNVQVVDLLGQPTGGTNNTNGLYNTETPIANKMAWMFYDAQLGLWIKGGGDATGNQGMQNNVPPTVLLQLCNLIGAHCQINLPWAALDPDQGYVTALANLAKSTLSPGIKFIAEPPDETWNGVYPWSQYATQKALANWGSGSYNDEYGKWLAIIGKDVSTVYGGDTTKYGVMGCEWSYGPAGSASSDLRFTSSLFVASGGWAAATYATNLCVAGYWNPAEYTTGQEIVDAYNYTTAGSTVTQGNLAASYALTGGVVTTATSSWTTSSTTIPVASCANVIATWLVYDVNGITATTNTASNSQIGTVSGCAGTTLTLNSAATKASAGSADRIIFQPPNMQALSLANANIMYSYWASRAASYNSTYGSSIVLNQYEGGYSPNILGGNVFLARGSAPNVTAMTIASSAVLTLQNDSFGGTMSAVAGMSVSLTGGSCPAFATAGNPYTVSSATGNQVTINLNSVGQSYTTNTCQMTYNNISASISSVTNAWPCGFVLASPFTIWPGSSGALTVTISGAATGGYNKSVQVTSIDSTGENITVALDCRALGAMGGTPIISAPISAAVNTLREASKFAASTQSQTTANFSNFALYGGVFPSLLEFSGNNWQGTNPGQVGGPVIWTAFDPSILTAPIPEWSAYASWSGGTYP